MKITDNVSLIREQTKTNTSTFTNDQIVLYYKAVLPQFQVDIEDANEGYMGSIEYRDLIATGTTGYTVNGDGDTVYTREYNVPADMLPRTHKVIAMLDGENWIELTRIYIEDAGVIEEENVLANYSNEEGVACYTIFRGSLWILSGEIEDTVTNGLKIWTYAYTTVIGEIPAVGSDDDVELEVYGIPEYMQELLAMAVSMRWKANQDIPVPLTGMEVNYYALYADALRKLKGMDRGAEMRFQRPADPYNNGFDL